MKDRPEISSMLTRRPVETLSRKYAGHIDYRTQVAPVDSNGKQMVYPFGVHDIYGTPAICQNLNRLICADVDNDRKLVGLQRRRYRCTGGTGHDRIRVLQGTTEGYLYAVNLTGDRNPLVEATWDHSAARRVAWKFKADGAVNTAVTLEDGIVYFGSNGGDIYALREADGTVCSGRPRWILR